MLHNRCSHAFHDSFYTRSGISAETVNYFFFGLSRIMYSWIVSMDVSKVVHAFFRLLEPRFQYPKTPNAMLISTQKQKDKPPNIQKDE